MSRLAGTLSGATLLALLLWAVPGDLGASETVKIVRDAWGIPHVFAASDEGAWFGAGYVAAADRMYHMHRARRAAQGRLAELLGLMGSGNQTTVEQDKNMRHRGFYRYADRRVAGLDAETRSFLEAYSAGVNQYVSRHPGQLLDLFDGEIPEPWTPADCMAVWDRIADFFSGFPASESKLLHDFEDLVRQIGLEAAIEQMTPNPITDDSAAVVKQSDLPAEVVQAMFDYAAQSSPCPPGSPASYRTPPYDPDGLPAPSFSHAWVVGGSRTTHGAAVLHSDPQTKISAPSIWYESHVRGATFDARGIGIAGCPGFLIGWNANVAWGLTALGADQADLFRLAMVGANQYVHDGVTQNIGVFQEQILVKGGSPVPITVKDTRLGPVVTPLVQDVDPGEEYVLRAIPQWDSGKHSVQAAVAMMRAHDVDSFFDAIRAWRGPSANCVFGDANGRIGYSVLAAIPTRSGCSPLAGMIAQDGSESRFDWVETVPFDVLPHVFDPADGVLFSANHMPIGSWYPIPLRPGSGGGGDGTRSWRLRERLIWDAPAFFSPADVFDVHLDSVNPARRVIVRAGYHLRDVQGAALSASARAALGALVGWYANGAHSLTSEPAQAVAHHMNLSFRQADAPNLIPIYGGGDNGLAFFLKTLDRRLDEDPQATLNADEIAYVDQSLRRGYDTAVAHYGSNPAAWPSAFANGPGTVKVLYFDTLEGFGSLDPTHDRSYTPVPVVDGGTIWSQRGQSYSQWVDLGSVNDSRAILPVGVAENPESPFFDDEGTLWLTGSLRASPLDQAANEAMATSIEVISYPAGSPIPVESSLVLALLSLSLLALGAMVIARRG